jgi:hypothetical protein
MPQLTPIRKLAEQYNDKPVVKALVQLITPYVDALDTLLMTHLQSFRDKRIITFFDELAILDIELNPELLVSEDFLHCCFATLKAAINTYQQEKIRKYANLLGAYTMSGNFADVDEYEEYLKILEELSLKEINILDILEAHEAKHPIREGENEGQRVNRFWASFTEILVNELKIPKEEIDARLMRLNRTGCYELLRTYVVGSKGKLTPTYFRLKQFLDANALDVVF